MYETPGSWWGRVWRWLFPKVVSTVTTTEVEWDEEQQNWHLAHLILEADRCPGCGNRWSETTSHDHVYEVEPLTRCDACTAIGTARENSTANQNGAFFFASKVEEGP